MSEQLTARQQILLWDLVSRGGSALQKDIRPEIKPADREPLRKAGYIVVSKEKNGSLQLAIAEEKSWNLLDAKPPTLRETVGSKYDRPILQFALERVSSFAKINGVGLAQIFAGRNIVAGNGESAQPPLDHQDPVRRQIMDAFSSIAGSPAVNQVRLRALRERLHHIPRNELDRALRDMRERRQASFSTLSNSTDITAEEDAALIIKDQTFHTIWIDT